MKNSLPRLPPIQHTKPDVFIIESLQEVDEQRKRYEGLALAEMLRLSGKSPKYYYFNESKELPDLFRLFRLSQYRYLHLSCHGSATDLIFRDEQISYVEFAKITAGHLRLRRLFVSACSLGNELFSTAVAGRNKGIHSIIGPADDIRFDHAAAIWNSFYVSVFTEDSSRMKKKHINDRLRHLRSLFPVEFHFSAYDAKNDRWTHTTPTKA